MRLGVRPSRRSRRRTHSSLKSGMSRLALQYSLKLRIDQLVKVSPSSAGSRADAHGRRVFATGASKLGKH